MYRTHLDCWPPTCHLISQWQAGNTAPLDLTSPDISIPPVLSVWCDLSNYPASGAEELAWCPGVVRWGRLLSAVKEYDRQNKSHQSLLTTRSVTSPAPDQVPAPVWPEERSVHHTPHTSSASQFSLNAGAGVTREVSSDVKQSTYASFEDYSQLRVWVIQQEYEKSNVSQPCSACRAVIRSSQLSDNDKILPAKQISQ